VKVNFFTWCIAFFHSQGEPLEANDFCDLQHIFSYRLTQTDARSVCVANFVETTTNGVILTFL